MKTRRCCSCLHELDARGVDIFVLLKYSRWVPRSWCRSVQQRCTCSSALYPRPSPLLPVVLVLLRPLECLPSDSAPRTGDSSYFLDVGLNVSTCIPYVFVCVSSPMHPICLSPLRLLIHVVPGPWGRFPATSSRSCHRSCWFRPPPFAPFGPRSRTT